MSFPGGGLAPRVALCFFVSGMPALISQVVWTRAFGRVFGSSTHATATVLTGFMVGLALGSALASRWADRIGRPLRAYGILELLIGAFGLLSLPLIEAASAAADRALPDAVPERTLGLFLLSLAILLVPTTLMGATFPFLAALAGRGHGVTLELLYGTNTLGAAAGAMVSGFVLVPFLGFQKTMIVAAACNGAAAILALSARAVEPLSGGAASTASEPLAPAAALLVLAFLAISGGATMAYEVVMARVTAMVFGSSVHSMALVLGAFLGGIALGGIGHHLSRHRGVTGRSAAGPLSLLIALGALAAVMMSLLVAYLPRIAFELHHALDERYLLLKACQLGLLFVLMLVPATVLGVTFPRALGSLVGGRARHGLGAGVGTSVNTVGAAVGAVAAGFWLMPRLGLEGLLEGAASMVAVTALLLSFVPGTASRTRLVAGTVAALVVVIADRGPAWRREEIAEGVFRTFEHYPSWAALQAELSDRTLLYYRDGPCASVAVFQNADGFKSLRVNGKADASTATIDLQTQYLTGHLPALLHPGPRTALVIGLGSGATAHAIVQYPTMKHLDVAELEPAVVEAATRHFGELHHGVMRDPRVSIHVEDGRRFVRRTTTRYDVVVSEPSNPWVVGVADLYTIEHFRRVRERLREDGIFVQWIQGYSLRPRWLLATLRTVAEAFPQVSVWFTNTGDFLLLASEEPLRLDVGRIRALWYELPFLEEQLKDSEIYGPRGLASRYLLDDRTVRELSVGAPILHEDLPLLESFAPMDLYGDTVTENFQALAARAVPCPVVDSGAPPKEREAAKEWADLARTAKLVGRTGIALAAYREAASRNPLPGTYADWARLLLEEKRDEEARDVVAEGLLANGADVDLTLLAKRLAPAIGGEGRGRS